MRQSLARISLLFFGISLLLWISLTAFESALVEMPPDAERLLTSVLLVLPAAIGAILGLLSLIHKEGRTGWAITGIVFNGLFALFQAAVLAFAG